MSLSVVCCYVFVVCGLLCGVVVLRICRVVGLWLSAVVCCVLFVGGRSLIAVRCSLCVGRCVLFAACS